MPLCPECQEMKDRWLDYQPRFRGYIDYSESHDRRAKVAIENYARQSEDHRKLVRRQIQGIRDACARLHQREEEPHGERSRVNPH